MKKVATKLRKWNRIFYAAMVCKKNLKRDIVIILGTIILAAMFIGTDRYLYNKKIRYHEESIAQAKEILSTQEISDETVSVQESLDATIPIEIKDSDPQPATAKVNTAKSITPKPTRSKATGVSCIKIPAHILPLIKNNPAPPDGKMKDGKLICNVLADGHKDHPRKSSKNSKGSWGGCCYDPDEVPNPACCYPVGSVYEKYLKKYFANPFPHRK